MPRDGYAWWYLDGLSDDGAHGVTLIAFVGSVFSPYYARARRLGRGDPENHCAFNVALYGRGPHRWSMTERGAGGVRRTADAMVIGRSRMGRCGDAVEIELDEVCAPVPRRVRGTVRLVPEVVCERSFTLDAAGRHRWTPFAPRARIEVDLAEPALRWRGTAYLDSNCGSEPLEDAFREWTWSRAHLGADAVILYEAALRDGSTRLLSLRVMRDGALHESEPPPAISLPGTGWRLARRTRADAAHGARVLETLEDTPFYSRSLLETHLYGGAATAFHESLDLDRFRARWVQCLLPFRMPRITF